MPGLFFILFTNPSLLNALGFLTTSLLFSPSNSPAKRDSKMADIQPNDTAPLSKERKRTRVQLSCTACRSRKLKCCRTHPCTNCLKRGEGHLCTFVGRGPRGRSSHGRSSPTHVQDRLQHLENLILSLAQQKKQDEGESEDATAALPPGALDLESRRQSMLLTPPSPSTGKLEGTGLEIGDSPPGQTGKLLVKETGTSYIDSAHWKAILEEINEFKESLRDTDELSDEETLQDEDSNDDAPTIWFGLGKPISKEELLSDIPSRLITDRMVSYFLTSKEPLVTSLHIPAFQKEYNKFWSQPQEVSLPWLGLLYAIMTLSASFYQRTGDPINGISGSYSEIISVYRKRSAQCLAQSNYIVAGQHKVEALFLYTMGEFYRSHDAETGVPFLLGITIKLAMRMGYHRDPSQFPAISARDGEMRRRMWIFLCQLDALFSFEVGIPRTIQDWQYDTELPRNLLDEDFDEHTLQLPPSRPLNEMTATTYTIAKARLMTTFGKILDMAFSRGTITYEETLEADRRLEEAHSLIPRAYQLRPTDQCIADPPELIFQRFTLENVYQKARCVLHRKYLGEVHTHLRYAYSRVVCITASKQILRVHADLHRETQPGGLLFRNRLFPNSIQYTDYLLAAMILCMELSYSHATGSLGTTSNDDVAVVIKDRDDLISTLETSHQILESLRRQSADAQKAHAALTIMLRRVKNGLHTIPPPNTNVPRSTTASQPTEPIIAQPPPYDSWPNIGTNLETPLYPANLLQDQMATADAHPYASLDVIGEMLDTPANLDWVSRIRIGIDIC
ncbi:fungal-specific transcription factor domain-containing protein [Aspergillus cavernicola]|uniref:Fungal-specific transcription factor domain-containing protein n=1 Tax=Aspergillus cavernicola TaxID=176166 RepID=A0ABR4IDW1_9EURO